MEVLLYTFKSFKALDKLEKEFGKVFIFNKLKDDLEQFKQIIKAQHPKYIIGVAKPPRTFSKIETKAINRFNKNKVNKLGKDSYDLFIPDWGYKSFTPTNTFCNWTMYKLSELIEGTNSKLIFLHLHESDIDKFIAEVAQLVEQRYRKP